jgi:acyl-CoA synthetase (AMP-forming)/AMP-acid ligase II
VPSLIERVLEYAEDADVSAEDFPYLEYIGAMPDLAPPERIAEITELFGAKFVNSFGATETGPAPASRDAIPVGHAPEEGDLSKVESVLCDVQLVDDDWETVPQGEIGEIAMRGPSLFSGYVNNPEANEEVFNDGWYRSGDLFVRNEDGTLDFVDRKKYLIKSGGENIYPAEIENELMRHEAIDEAAAVRVPDDRWGEVPKVYVVGEADRVDADDLLDYLDGRIARYKLPHYLEFVDGERFPRSTTGKVKRREVEDWTENDDQRVRDP